MIRRILATAAIAGLYIFISLQGVPRSGSSSAPVTELGEDDLEAETRTIDKSLPSTITVGKLPSGEASTPVSSLVAHYNESRRAWTFSAKIIQLNDVLIYGRPGRIAKIEFLRAGQIQHAWAVIQIEDFCFCDDPGAIAEGAELVLEASGKHVSRLGVDWNLCLPDDLYCQYAAFIEGGFPTSEDYNGLTICPSNSLVYSGYVSRDWINGMLAWKITTKEPS